MRPPLVGWALLTGTAAHSELTERISPLDRPAQLSLLDLSVDLMGWGVEVPAAVSFVTNRFVSARSLHYDAGGPCLSNMQGKNPGRAPYRTEVHEGLMDPTVREDAMTGLGLTRRTVNLGLRG